MLSLRVSPKPMTQCPSCDTENDTAAVRCAACGLDMQRLTAGAVVASRYEILERLGRGGMGIVFKARDRMFDETVALKVLRTDTLTPEAARRFHEEIRLARKVTHRNVCRMHEYGEEDGLRYISMAFVDGVDLKRVLQERGALPLEEAFAVSLDVAEALRAIHDEGIVHRDLKTPNIMRDRRGIVKLMDFGIAKATESGARDMTATGMIVGTPEYMSPEQVRGQKLSFGCDIYALGIVVFELFTGRVPFRGDTPIGTLMKHLQEPPPLEGPEAARLPTLLVPVLRKALAKDPAERYGSASEMAVALRAAQEAAEAERVTAPIRTAAVPLTKAIASTGPVSMETAPTAPAAVASASVPAPARWVLPSLLAAAVVAGGVVLARRPPHRPELSPPGAAIILPPTMAAGACVGDGRGWPARIRLDGFDAAAAARLASAWPFVAVVGAPCEAEGTVSAGPPLSVLDAGGTTLADAIRSTGEAAQMELGAHLRVLHMTRLLLGPRPTASGLEVRIARGTSAGPGDVSALRAGIDRMAYWVRSARPGRLLLLELSPAGQVAVLYPNMYESSALAPGVWTRVPEGRSIPVDPPQGQERAVAIAFDNASPLVGLDQLYPGLWQGPRGTAEPFRTFRGDDARRFVEEVSRRLTGEGWARAEGRFRIE